MLSLYKERLYLSAYGYAESILKRLSEGKEIVPVEKVLQYPIFKSTIVRYK